MLDHKISPRTSRVLNIFLMGLVFVLARVWYLTVLDREGQLQQGARPERRSAIQKVERATIRDRFNIPLAINKIQYNAAVCYAPIRQIPVTEWQKEGGKPCKVFARKRYIQKLSEWLAKELSMDPLEIEDMIHGKASLLPHTPFVLKEDIPETLYYRLKMAEKDWIGLQVERGAKRIYPQGKTACDAIGYIGMIHSTEYYKIAQEIKELQRYLSAREEGEMVFLPKGYQTPLQVRQRLKVLQEKAYTLNDFVGKAGIEKYFDEQLRGLYGKKNYEVDVKGNFLRELPGGRPPVSGERLILTLSSELQKTAEELLSSYELFQDQRDLEKNPNRRRPWQRGGAIVAMVPKTGEIVALASYPRFDPNDFTCLRDPQKRKEKRSHILKWLENETYIGELWDGKAALSRELYDPKQRRYVEEELPVTWDYFLSQILSKESAVRKALDKVPTLHDALAMQDTPNENEPPLFLDLLRLVARSEDFSPLLRASLGSMTLSDHRALAQSINRHVDTLRAQAESHFKQSYFSSWRANHFKPYLEEKRLEEKKRKKSARPYPEYLEQAFKKMFKEFWEQNRLLLIDLFVETSDDPELEALRRFLATLPSKELRLEFLKSLRPFEQLTGALAGRYPNLRKEGGRHLEKHLAAAFYPYGGFGYARSQAYRQSTPLGSIFKVAVAHEALKKQYAHAPHALNPLTLTDISRDPVMGVLETGETVKRLYKGGKLPKSSHPDMGKLDLQGALEQSSNVYFSLLAGDYIQDGEMLEKMARSFGFGDKTGIELPGEYGGNIPDDLHFNKTGLYAYAIGQHSLVVTPLQTALFLSSIANGGKLLKPKIVHLAASHAPDTEETRLFAQEDYPLKEPLALIGIHFPLFTQTITPSSKGMISLKPAEVKKEVDLPPPMRTYLLDGMKRVMTGKRGTARPAIIRTATQDPKTIESYLKLANDVVGKTGTAEILYKPTLDSESKAVKEKHTWFAGVSFADKAYEEPELVVVVYLRFGDAGRDAAPLALRLFDKWRELNQLREKIGQGHG